MAAIAENGYLGGITVESGTARRATVDPDGNALYAPVSEAAWAAELIGADGRYRYLNSGGAAAANALVHDFNDQFTVLALTRMKTQLNDYGAIIAKSNYSSAGWAIMEIDQNNAYFGRIETSAKTNQAIGFGQADMKKCFDRNWHWQGWAFDNGTGRRWLDGQQLASGSYLVGAGLSNGNSFYVATSSSVQTQIACVLIFNRVLSTTEIANIVSGKTMPGSVTGLAGYYKFNEARGMVCTDYSGNGNHLTYSSDAALITEEWAPDGNLVRDPNFNNPNVWVNTPGMTVSAGGGKLVVNNPAGNSMLRQQNVGGLVYGATYRVTYEIRNWVSGTMRIRVFGVNGCGTATTTRSGNGVYVEDITLTGAGSSPFNSVSPNPQSADAVMEVYNISVVRLWGTDGGNGMPYPSRAASPISLDMNKLFRAPPSLPSAAAQGSVISANNWLPTVPDAPSLQVTGDITVVGWVKPMTTAFSPVTVSCKGTAEWRLDINNNGKLLVFYRGATSVNLTLARPLPNNAWALVGAVHTAGVVGFYVNGLFAGAKPFTPTVTASTNVVSLGGFITGRPNGIRSLRVFNRALAAGEIDALFQTDFYANTDRAMVGEWMCNEPWYPIIRDTSGNGNHSLTSSSPTSLDSPYVCQRLRRKGKQVSQYSPSQVVSHSSADFRNKLVGRRYVVVSTWLKTHVTLGNSSQRFGFNTSSQFAGSIIGGYNGLWGQLAGYSRAKDGDATANTMFLRNSLAAQRGTWALYTVETDYTAGTMSIYVNGILAEYYINAFSNPTFWDIGQPTAVLMMGNGNGQVKTDACRIYNRKLSAVEHRAMFFDQAPRDGLVLEWCFDNDDLLVRDTSGNGFDGAVSNGLSYISEP